MNKKILIVDDEANIRFLIKTALASFNLDIYTAEDGEKAFEQYKKEPVDLVVTDIIMPNKEGAQLISELKALNEDLKIVAISGGGLIGPNTYLELAQQLGADHILSKPFSISELKTIVKDLLDLQD